MPNSLIKKRDNFLTKSIMWIRNKWRNISGGFKQLSQTDLSEDGRMFETEDKAGKKYLFKRAISKSGEYEPFRAEIQEAMYNLQQKLNPNGSILCYTTRIDGIYGAVQEKIDTRDSFEILRWQIHGGEIQQEFLDGILQEYIVDWVSGNFDSNGSHFLIDANGRIRCCDKEQAFRYLFDERSQKPSLYYNPNSYVGEIEPIYNTIFQRFITGELDFDFNIIRESISRLEAISDKEYIGIFKRYVDKLGERDKQRYFDAILERKHNARLYIEEFISEIVAKRDEYSRGHKEKGDSLSINDSSPLEVGQVSKLTSGNNLVNVDGNPSGTLSTEELEMPPFGFEPITIDSAGDGNENTENPSKNKVEKMLAKYGITKEEWQEIEHYKGSEYFLPTTLLHRIDLFRYNRPSFGDVFENAECWLDPKKALDSYCKIYSAMCKFAKRYNKGTNIFRVCSNLFHGEMSKTGQTASMLSFSENGFQLDFMKDKSNVELLQGTLRRGTPCIVFSEITGEDIEEEVLIPPFLNISYESIDNPENSNYPKYSITISNEFSKRLSKEENDRMLSLEQSVLNSNIPSEYYHHWYSTSCTDLGSQGDDEESIRLKQEFFLWQDAFKEYLQLKFREIQYEINHPQLNPSDFLSWAIERVEEGKTGLKEKIIQMRETFTSFFQERPDNSKENR